MADNVTLNPSTGSGAVVHTKSLTLSGDSSAMVQGVSLIGISGSEGSWSAADINGTSSRGLWVQAQPSTSVIGLVKPSSAFDVLATPSSTFDVAVQNTVTITPSSGMDVLAVASTGGFQVAGTVTATVSSSDISTIAISSGSITPSSNITITPSSTMDVLAVPSSTYDVEVQNTVTVTPSSTMDVSVQEILAGSNLIGDVGISGARTSGGATTYFLNPTSSRTGGAGSAPEVKTSAGQIYYIHAINMSSEPLFLHLYAARSTGIVVGSTGATPNHTFGIPAQADGNGAGFNMAVPNGMALANGISYGVTKDIAHSSSLGSTGSAVVNFGYG